ncbi:MAG: hypothetical protein VKL39_10055 [Leptolyngbyaceae bacterium]|nr:hypothetical protein [Leptolyngbyaceae bacterium]
MPLNHAQTSLLTLIKDNEFQLQFDPVDAIDNPESIAFTISFTWNMPFQQHQFVIRECWFLAQSLRHFESQLKSLIQNQTGSASLQNMDDCPVLSIEMESNAAQIIFLATDTAGIGNLQFTLNTHANQIRDVYHYLHNYPKWW